MLEFTFVHSTGTISGLARDVTRTGWHSGGVIVIGRQYFARQAITLLKFASSTTNAKLAAALIQKASDLKSQVDEASPPPDRSPRAPDVDSAA